MKALVTGATGFLGKCVVAELLAQGAEVRCLVRPKSDIQSLRELVVSKGAGCLTLMFGTLANSDDCETAMLGCDTVFHLAAAMKGATAVLFQHNVVGTQMLIELAGKCRVSRFVLVSSLGVYGTYKLRVGDVLDEQCPLDAKPHARDPYSYSKVAQERAAHVAAEKANVPLVIVRPGVIYGPGRDCITSRLGLRIGRRLVLMGGCQQLPYTFVQNCAEAIVLAGTVPGIAGEAFNIIDDDPPTANALLRMYRRKVGKLRSIRIPHSMILPVSRFCEWYHRYSNGQLPAVLTPYKSAAMWKRLKYSNSKAKRLLGWKPQVPFQTGLERTLSVWSKQSKAEM